MKILWACLLVLLGAASVANAAEPSEKAVPQGQVAVVEVIVHPLFQRSNFVKKVYESYEERLQLNQAVMDHVKYRLGNALIAEHLFTSQLPLEIKFELLRVDIVNEWEQIDPVTKERSPLLGSGGHAIATAKLTFDKDGQVFEHRYKTTQDKKLKFTSSKATNKALLGTALDDLIQSALADPKLVAFLSS